MKILYISSDHFPYQIKIPSNGTQRRQRLFLDAISKIAEIDFLYYVPHDVEVSENATHVIKQEIHAHWNIDVNLHLCRYNSYPNNISLWSKHKQGIFNFFKQWLYRRTSGELQIRVLEERLQQKPDLIVAQRLTSMPPVLLTKMPLPPILFDLDDVEHIRFMRQLKNSRSFKDILYGLHFPARAWGEYNAIKNSAKTFVCSERDHNYLNQILGFSGLVTIPNSIQIPEPSPIVNEPTLLFLGTYAYSPNVGAANFLVEQVFPRIHQAFPTAELILAGKEPEKIRSYSKSIPGVKFVGFVDDLDSLYRKTRVVCCPIFSGGGTRVKMVEAAAYGKPIVATKIGAEGLSMENGKHFLMAERAEEFAAACVKLLSDSLLCHQLGDAARKVAIHKYDYQMISEKIQYEISSAIQPSGKGFYYAQ